MVPKEAIGCFVWEKGITEHKFKIKIYNLNKAKVITSGCGEIGRRARLRI